VAGAARHFIDLQTNRAIGQILRKSLFSGISMVWRGLIPCDWQLSV
jgi:hypothetical protein